MISKLSKSNTKEAIYYALNECRFKTLKLFDELDDTTFRTQYHPDFSPVGWHLGHIAYTESLWLLEHSAGLRCLFPQYRKLFAADGLPKYERVQLPNLEEIGDYLHTVRAKVLEYLEVADIEPQERLWRFLIQHESQHCEILSYVLELAKIENGARVQEGKGAGGEYLTQHSALSTQHSALSTQHSALSTQHSTLSTQHSALSTQHSALSTPMVMIPAGEFEQGNNSIDALDNEIRCHRVYLDSYWIDRYPVTCGQYREFMVAGGYKNPELWSEAGWQWLQTEQVTQPLYWHSDRSYDDHPVCGVSWYEAEAYSRFVGKRLPTEAEWEKAASWDAQAQSRRTYPWGEEMPTSEYCNCDRLMGQTTPVNTYSAGKSAYGLFDTLGNVWEWTASWFAPYQGFQSYPYVGYSQVYFDNQHCVLKGGSWATRPWVLRSSFRNWYYPSVRQVFTGFRCAASSD